MSRLDEEPIAASADAMGNSKAGAFGHNRGEDHAANPLTLIRLRWSWVAAAVVLGGLLGGLASGATGYQATALMQLTQTSQDSLRTKQIGQTVERTAASSTVVAAAASHLGIPPGGLAERLSVAWVEDTDLVEISVRAADARTAVAQVNAVAEAVGAVSARQSRAQLDSIRRTGNQLLRTGKLDEAEAERTRQSQLGAGVAAQQNDAATSSGAVVLLDPAVAAAVTGLSRPVGAALGAFAGAVVAAGAALLVPFRRRRVRSAEDLEVLLPQVRVLPADSIVVGLASLVVGSGRRDLALVAMHGSTATASTIGQGVVDLLQARGVPAAVSDAAGRHQPQQLNGHVRVTVDSAQAGSLNVLDLSPSLLTVVVAKAGQQRIGELRWVTARLRHADPTVILTP